MGPLLVVTGPPGAGKSTVTRAAAGLYAGGGFTTVFDGMVGPWFLPTFAVATARERIDYTMLMPPVERCVQRVAHRRDHGFTDEPATRKMHAEFAKAAVDARHVFVDPPDEAELVADLIRSRWDADELRYRPS